MTMAGWMLTALTVLLTTLAAGALEAQSARLLGRVTDAAGRPLRDAAVVLEPEGSGDTIATTSGATGGYQFSGVAPGVYSVSTATPGYRGSAMRVRVREGLVLVPVIRLPSSGPARRSTHVSRIGP
jgi:protocatechuate 3,4-dioxygenase beta subunit